MIKKTIALGMLLASFASHADDWTRQDTYRELLFTVPAVIDYFQARDMVDNYGKFHENNPVLGRYPSQGKLNTFAVIGIAGHYLVSRTLTGKTRATWQYSTATIEIGNVIRNHVVIGVRMKF
jgi:hypothetical protein